MSWLLDTCVVSEETKKAPNLKVIAWVDAQNEAELYLSALTLGEIAKGFALMPEGAHRRRVEEWLQNQLGQRFAGRILPIDDAVARTWGKLQAEAERKGRPLPIVDSLIAATALVHSLTVVTRDTADIAPTGAKIFNPWAE